MKRILSLNDASNPLKDNVKSMVEAIDSAGTAAVAGVASTASPFITEASIVAV